jgi:signal transduction histidine kinase
LRSPLNVIIGYSQILEGLDPASDAHSRAVDAIRRNALAEARLVEDTLELSRIVSGKLVLKRAAFHLGETIREVVDAVRVTIDGKDLQLLAEIDAAVGACDGDEGRIRQVLSNILSNAVKFNTENGQIRLSARRVGRDYEIAVEDTGIGLERDELGRVFDHFWQADTGRTRRFEGLGIGLSLVRHLVDAHGGKVSAYSAGRNCGTTFVVTLPGPEDLAAGARQDCE